GRWRGASWPSQTRSASCVASSRLLRLALGPRWFARGLTLEEREEPLEVVVEARELAHQRRRGGFVEAMAHLRAVELDVAHAALSSRAASTRFFKPKKRKPFQGVPVMCFATAESVLKRWPAYSKPSLQTVTSCATPSKTRRSTVPTGGIRGSRGSSAGAGVASVGASRIRQRSGI